MLPRSIKFGAHESSSRAVRGPEGRQDESNAEVKHRARLGFGGTPDVKCVTVSNGVQSGQPIVIAAWNGAAEQQWQPGVDWTSIVLRSAAICIDLPGGNATPGTGLLSFSCGGNINQKWTARVVPPPDVTQEHAAPVLSTPAHNGDNRNFALCGATCFELTASYSTPAYVSMDQPRSVTMVYLV